MFLIDDECCFGCGEKNASGLRMRYEEDAPPGTARALAFIDERFQGWQGIAHGGILATMLDDAMAYVGVTVLERPGVMARLNMRFHKPAATGETVEVRARVVWRKRNALGLEARIANEAGELLTSAEGTFIGNGSENQNRR